ncbi:hypothetical protein [Croceicoccus ponticola]|uniref:hypothetical protein n=1 Tax=Croceicoccus ponticola TaxID=2217664 RepID=UPI000FD95D77|nr:hypothetical protein [Croceicoccus ponticola]
MSITPIGTCRINTPLRRAIDHYPVVLDADLVYGFSHTSDEALQQIRFIQGEKRFDERSADCLFRAAQVPAVLSGANVGPTDGSAPQPADLYIVEISSAKKITALGDSLQINYLYRAFPSVFSQPGTITKFWSLAKHVERDAFLTFLGSLPAFRALDDAARALLSDVRLVIQDGVAIAADMRDIVDRLGADRVLFVTHVNAITDENRVIAGRDRIIKAVKQAATELGVPCYDPTDAMLTVGQEVAMEKGGADLTHYTLAFSDLVFLDIYKQFLAPRFGDRVAVDVAAIAAQIDEEVVAGRIGRLLDHHPRLAEAELSVALRRMPNAHSLLEMRGRLLFARERFDEAREILASLDAQNALSSSGRRELLDISVRQQDWQTAKTLFEALIGEEYEDREVFLLGARAYEQLGETKAAIDNYIRAFQANLDNTELALRALELLAQTGDKARAGSLRQQVVDAAIAGRIDAEALREWALRHRDAKVLAGVRALDASGNFAKTCEVTDQLIEFGDADAAAAAFADVVALAGTDADSRRDAERISNRLYDWAEAEALAGNHGPAYVLSEASAVHGGRPVSAACRDSRESFAARIEAASAALDYPAIAALAGSAPALVHSRERLTLIWGAALQKLGLCEQAVEVLADGYHLRPDDIDLLRMYARVAAIGGRYDLALPLFRKLRASGEPARRYDAEIERFFGNVEPRALKMIGKFADAGEHDRAFAIYNDLGEWVEDRESLHKAGGKMARALWLEVRQLAANAGLENEVEAKLRRILAIDPDHVRAIRQLGKLLMEQNRFREAKTYWLSAMALDPSNVADMRNSRRCSMMMDKMSIEAAIA